MSARVEAAAMELLRAEESGGTSLTDRATAVLAAADAVMFDEAAVERAAQALHGEYGPAWEYLMEDHKEKRREAVHAVIAALKGDDR